MKSIDIYTNVWNLISNELTLNRQSLRIKEDISFLLKRFNWFITVCVQAFEKKAERHS